MAFVTTVNRFNATPAVAFWCWLFAWSKVVELGDTVFIVLRKRPLTFLHVFHHCTMLVGSFYVGKEIAAIGRWPVTINYFIHSIMYTYFALQILGLFKIPKWISMTVTTMQAS